MEGNAVLERGADAAEEDFGDSVLVTDAKTDRWLILRGSAADIWRQLDRPRTLDGLCQSLAKRYEGDDERIRADVSEFVEKLREAGLLLVRAEAEGPVPP